MKIGRRTTYKKQYKPVQKISKECKYCNKKFIGNSINAYCSKDCYESYNRKKMREKHIPIKNFISKELNCKFCNKLFLQKQKSQIYCSKECSKKYYKEIYEKIVNGIEDETTKQYKGKFLEFLRLRFKIFNRDNFQCQYCGRTPKKDGCKLHIDHIMPVSNGGDNKICNLITSCQECNLGKSDILLEEHKLKEIIKNEI